MEGSDNPITSEQPCQASIPLLLVRIWARVQRVSLGKESSEGEILGVCLCMSLLWLRFRRCVCTMLVCICVEFAEICCCVTVSGCVSMLVV